MNDNSNKHLYKYQQDQLLKLVAKSFYKELVKYGVESSDIVTVSLHLLDHLTDQSSSDDRVGRYFSSEFLLQDIADNWKEKEQLSIHKVSLKLLLPNQISLICRWLKKSEIQMTFIDFLPKNEIELSQYMFEDPERTYFGIHYDGTFVGIIGAENIDKTHHKLEMKKFIGADDFSGKGIGKRATFLFLYYVFMILGFNKVFIHSMDTNIRNINLNSKFGFELEGIFFQEIYRNGELFDVVRMGLLKNNWMEIFSG
ncbi:MAG: N-acetyltransferase [Calditrichaeota bacterium]|nr:GNAT family N-acetyltransferase [Calditrichota bacterium]RQW07039.1 MAG: N-acetyltransferase [Calditrichota bacterium]